MLLLWLLSYMVSALKCPVGTYFIAGECIGCPPSQYNDAPGATACKLCGFGTIPTASKAGCECDAGHDSFDVFKRTCKPCALGKYRKTQDECQSCDFGFFAPNPRSDKCHACGKHTLWTKNVASCSCPSLMVLENGRCIPYDRAGVSLGDALLYTMGVKELPLHHPLTRGSFDKSKKSFEGFEGSGSESGSEEEESDSFDKNGELSLVKSDTKGGFIRGNSVKSIRSRFIEKEDSLRISTHDLTLESIKEP